MKLREVLLVAGKELRETLRDRRTLAVMVLFPLVVYPAVSLVTTQVMAVRATRTESETARVTVAGPEALAARVRERLAARGRALALAPPSADPKADVVAARVDAAALVAAGAAGQPPVVRVLFDETRESSRQAHERISEALSGAGPECAPAFAVAAEGIAARASIGGYVLSKILPLIVVVMIMLGAFHPAIDITAGERERGTLETTLSAPIHRTSLMGGKVLAVATLAAITGFLNLASMSLTVLQGARMVADSGSFTLPWLRAASVLLVVPPTAFLFASVMVAIGSVARSFKEAQTLLTPVYFLCMAPSLTAALGDFELRGAAILVPGVNVTLLARDLVVGRASLAITLAVFAITLVYSGAALALAAKLYDSERLLGADEPGLPLATWLRRLFRSTSSTSPSSEAPGGAPASREGRGQPPQTTAGDALALYGVAWVLLLVLAPLQKRSLPVGLLIFEWVGLLGLTALYARGSGRRLAAVIRFERPPARALVGAVLIGMSAWLVLGLLVDWVVPAPKELVDQLRRTIAPPGGGPGGLPFSLFLTALTPAICEEALFRGPILRGLRARFPPAAAVILTGLLFGLYHGDPYRLLPTAALGTALGVLALASGSIVPAMVAHFVSNACLVLLAHLQADDTGRLAVGTRLAFIAVGGAVLACGFALLRKSPGTRRVM